MASEKISSIAATIRRASLEPEQRHASKTKFRPMTFPRKRAITACESCRSRKTKCDNARPICATCAKHNLPCSYDPRLGHYSFDSASLLIIEKLNRALQKLDSLGNAVGSNSALQAQLDLNESTGAINEHSISRDTVQDHFEQSCSHDCLEVPAAYSSADHILTWPVFAQRWPRDILANELHVDNFASACQDNLEISMENRKHGIREEDAPELVDRFLELVHSKNPIFCSRTIREDARNVAENGLGWDAPSCLVLLACALGTIATPFDPSYEGGQLRGRKSLDEAFDRRNRAEAHYKAARKRLGLLQGSLMACQCHLLSGIYLMYTIRPLQGWSAFHLAASTYSLYLKGKTALRERYDSSESGIRPSERRLEQRLYWTCLKSECEIRSELDLPQSDLCKLGYPYLFPSPPTPSSPAQIAQDDIPALTPVSSTTASTQLRTISSHSSYQKTEEKSWFYYLSEIALRRIENRVLNVFYKYDHYSWSKTNLRAMVSAAKDLEAQLATWYSSLPTPIQYENLPPDVESDELRFMTRGRSMVIRLLLYRPFLYYGVHFGRDSDPAMSADIDIFIQKALAVCVEYNSGHAMTHRHHGTWYGLRECFAAGLMIFAAKNSGTLNMASSSQNDVASYEHAMQICLEYLRYWEAESADCARSREIIESLLGSVG